MIAFRHFQGLLRMLACDTRNPDTKDVTPQSTPRIPAPSTATPSSRRVGYGYNHDEPPSICSSPIRRPDTVAYHNDMRRHQCVNSCYNQRPVINVGVVGTPQSSGIRFKSTTRKTSLVPEKNNPLRGYVHRNQLETKPIENEFSRYKPLPAINGTEKCQKHFDEGDYYVDAKRTTESPKKLKRQLTYRVLKPVLVKGPTDMKNTRLKTGSLGSGSPTRSFIDEMRLKHQRAKTVVIRSDKTSFGRKFDNNVKDLTRDDEDFGYDSEGNTPAGKSFQTNPSSVTPKHRLMVRKDLIEAGEKLRRGLSSHDSAFWFEL